MLGGGGVRGGGWGSGLGLPSRQQRSHDVNDPNSLLALLSAGFSLKCDSLGFHLRHLLIKLTKTKHS